MISVIVPAHDEELTIERCLTQLLHGAEPGELEVIVACNGCVDATAAVSQRFGPPVRVLSTPVASKAEALNLGDAMATGFPRFYMDADVGLDIDGVRAIAKVLDAGEGLVAAPSLFVETSVSSRLVRSYYRIYQALPSIRADVAGRGVYALSRIGRARFGDFPHLNADDYFVRSTFAPHERRCVSSVVSTVVAPCTLRGLVRRKARIVAGNTEVDRLMGPPVHDLRRARGLFATVFARPSLAVDLPAYLLVGVAARVMLWRSAVRGRPLEWGRDDSRP